jgi:hypothetical protein
MIARGTPPPGGIHAPLVRKLAWGRAGTIVAGPPDTVVFLPSRREIPG